MGGLGRRVGETWDSDGLGIGIGVGIGLGLGIACGVLK